MKRYERTKIKNEYWSNSKNFPFFLSSTRCKKNFCFLFIWSAHDTFYDKQYWKLSEWIELTKCFINVIHRLVSMNGKQTSNNETIEQKHENESSSTKAKEILIMLYCERSNILTQMQYLSKFDVSFRNDIIMFNCITIPVHIQHALKCVFVIRLKEKRKISWMIQRNYNVLLISSFMNN